MSGQDGIRSAAGVAGAYLAIYALAGLILIPVVSGIAGPSEIGDLTGLYLLVLFISSVVLWPSCATVAWILRRWVEPPSSGRLRLAGLLAVPVVWLGTMIGANYSERLHQGMAAAFGTHWGMILLSFGWAVLFSNLTLAVAWLLPYRKGTVTVRA